MDALTENPYLLCDEYYEIDFGMADGLALNLGLPRLSDERADAGVLYTMSFNLSNGHTILSRSKNWSRLHAGCSATTRLNSMRNARMPACTGWKHADRSCANKSPGVTQSI